jgi:hypothetical protein
MVGRVAGVLAVGNVSCDVVAKRLAPFHCETVIAGVNYQIPPKGAIRYKLG